MKRWGVLAMLLVALVFGLSACHGGEHYEFTVNTALDAPDASPGDGVCEADLLQGVCTLRAAIDESNALAAAHLAGGSTTPLAHLPGGESLDDTLAAAPPQVAIVLASEVVLEIAGPGEDDNATGDLDIMADVTIDGAGFTIDGFDLDRSIHLSSGDVTITDLTIVNGTADKGGGIRTEAGTTLALLTSTVADNQTTGQGVCGYIGGWRPFCPSTPDGLFGGAGVWSEGSLVVVGTTLARNDTPPAACTTPDPTLPEVCTFSVGGGIAAFDELVVADSTFTDNTARSGFGSFFGPIPFNPASGIFTGLTPATVVYSTFVDNGVNPTDPLNLRGVAPRATLLVDSECSALAPAAGDHNLASDCPGPGGGDDGVGPLADNGGPTETHALASGSSAVDAIPTGTVGLCDGSIGNDQRRAPRPAGNGCDVGAFERQAADP